MSGPGTLDTCRGTDCGARIRWVPTPAGKSMPLDVDPTPDGNVEIVDGLAIVHNEPGGGLVPFEGWMPHFATCPNAGDFYRPKGRR